MTVPVQQDTIREELEKVLSASMFRRAERSSALLRFVVEETIEGRADRLKEYTLGAEALGRGQDFDPRTDPTVRAEASRLRTRLAQYYETDGLLDTLVITLPRGNYVPQFVPREPEREAEEPEGSPTSTAEGKSNRNTQKIVVRLTTTAVLLACAFAAGYFCAGGRHPPGDQPLQQFDVALPSQGTLGGEVGPSIIFSPDGTRVVFVASDEHGIAHLHSSRLDQAEETELPGTDGARVPFFSPDGRWVGFWSGGKLKKTEVEGGSPVVLCDTPDVLGASWGKDGQIIASFGGSQLVTIPGNGGSPRTLIDLAQESEAPRWPQIVLDGKAVIFTAIGSAGSNQGKIEALILGTGKRIVLATGGTFGRLIADAYLTFVNQGTLFAAPFDWKAMAATGSPAPVLEGVSFSPAFGYAELDVSRAGDLVYRRYHQDQLLAEWVDPQGEPELALPSPGSYLWPRLSHDLRRVTVMMTQSGESQLVVFELANGRTLRLPLPPQPYFPLWTPNDRFLIVGSRGALFWLPADGTGHPQVLLRVSDAVVPWSFSPDGTRIAYHARGESTGLDLWTVPVKVTDKGVSAGKPELFLGTKAFEAYPTFSPDGRWMAYTSNESGNWYIYVRSFPDNGKEIQVSSSDGRIPFWLAAKHELLYRTDDQRIMAADYSIDHGAFVVHSLRQWSPARLADTGVLANLDLDAQRERFIALRASASAEPQVDPRVTFMLHFYQDLAHRLHSQPR